MELKIESRNVGMTPRWKAEIEERAAALETDSLRITHARVTLTKNTHHKKGSKNAEALVVINIPKRHTITARKEAKTFEEAIRAAFAAVEIELEKIQEKRASKEPPSQPSLPHLGVINKIFRQEGYGFIVQDGGMEVYFHKNALRGFDFAKLEDGMEVTFNMEDGEKGPQATVVLPLPLIAV